MKKAIPEIVDTKKLDWSIGLLISVAALAFASLSGFTAYQYNEIDMLPFWERKTNPDFLLNDFFTNASVSPNSRQVWGYFVLTFAKLTGAHWYTVLYLIKLLFVGSIGSLYYLVLSRFYKHFVNKQIVLFKLLSGIFCILCVSNAYFVQLFTIAWWPPFIPDANAHNISIFFGLSSVLLVGKPTGMLLSLASAMLHPVLGFVFFFLHALFLVSEKKYLVLLLSFICAIVVPYLFHAFAFGSDNSLSAKEFTDLYAWYRHPGHYIPSLFGRMGLSSLQVYALNFLLMGGALWYSIMTRNKTLLYFCLGMLVFVHALLGLQYFLVEKYPVKLIAILGPSRYLMFMGWGIAFLYACIFAEFLKPFQSNTARILVFLEKKGVIYAVGMLVAATFGFLVFQLDNPIAEKDTPVLTWIRTQTPEGSTIVSNNWILDEMDIRYIAQRAVYVGDCFPFKEDFFREYYRRSVSVYGTPEDWKGEKNIVLQRLYFFRRMNPEDFVDASERFPLDYVVVDARDSLRFLDFTPEYKDPYHRIYSISAFKGNMLKHQPFVTWATPTIP